MALELIAVACDAAAKLGTDRILAVHVRIGPLAGVVDEALRFSFEVAAGGTAAENAVLVFEPAPLVAFCSACGEEKAIPTAQHLRCPECGAPTPDIRCGRELELVALEIPDATNRPDSPEHPQEERPHGR